MKKKTRKWWIFTTTYYCPLCGRESSYRERRYTKKPLQFLRRSKIVEAWDYCGAL
jgi:hypothetical protein